MYQKANATLQPSNPNLQTLFSGTEYTGTISDNWSVPYKGYKLKKVTMWKNTVNTSGFEVTYVPPGTTSGWPIDPHPLGLPDEVHMYGTTYST